MKLSIQALGLMCLAVFVFACHEAPVGDSFADQNYGATGAVVSPRNVQVGFFDLADPDNASIAFDLETIGETVSSAEVTVIHSDGSSASFTTVSSFPSTVSVTLDEVLSVINKSRDDVAVGESVRFLFTATTGGGVFRSSESLSVPFSCKSDLAGEMTFKSTNYFCGGGDLTGTVELIERGAGSYSFDDWSFGTYTECYGGPPAESALRLEDVCNKISVTGVDAYGDSWELIINSIQGEELDATWTNTYGEFGSVVLTRPGGWPPISN